MSTTETALQADYVLPATSQFEKAEATFFNLEFPRNGFHLRQPLFEPRPGTLTEAEIHSRLLEALGEVDERQYRFLRRAARMRGDGIVPGRSKTTTTFEYVGKTAMAVTCSESGRRYHFASPGARVEVDSRDVDSLASV